MPKAARDKLGNKGKIDVYLFDPEDVVLVEEKDSALYDERVDNDFKESLVLNMMFAPDGVPQGVIETLSGRRNSETGKVEIIDGRQRTKAAREANKRLKKQGLEPIRLPVHIKRANDQRAMAMLISANEHRTEDSADARARKAQRYIDLGRDEKEVAVLLGVSESTVKNLLRLLDAPAAVRNAEAAGKISTSDAYKLAREEPERAKEMLSELLEKAPRTPGKKRSKNAKKAREIVRGSKAKSEARETRKLEKEVAESIAAWIEATWNSKGDWAGAPDQIPALIRSGEWRKHRAAEDDAAE
jgi:ParB family transcriptional regulator, chromosome partitioning protein